MNNYAFCFKGVKSYLLLLFKISHGKTRQLTIMAVSILANLTNSIVHTGQRMTWPPVCFQFISNREKMLPRYVVVAGSLNHCPRPSRLTLLRVVVLYTDCWGRNTTVAGQSNHASCIHFIRYPACLYKGPPWAVLVLPFTMLGSS